MKIETKTVEQKYQEEQRAGAITLIYIAFVVGLLAGTSFGLWRVCAAKDQQVDMLLWRLNKIDEQTQPVDVKKDIIPKNLPKITALKGI